jgi:activator of HSP90 ATPase
MKVEIKELSDISGDVTVAQRKGKIMCYFELKMTLKWKGDVSGDTNKAEGKLVIPEVEHDSFRDDYEITVSASETNAASRKVEEWIRANARPAVRQVIRKYFEEVFTAHNVGANVKQQSPVTQPPPQAKVAVAAKKAPAATSTGGSKSTIEWRIQWRVPVEDLFAVLMNEQRASMYTRAPAKIDPRTGGGFEFLGGVISGYFAEVSHPNKIVMQWRLASWPTGVFSSVVMVLKKDEAAVTILEFAQAGIPEGEVEGVKQGWMVNFFDPIKMICGYAMEFL